MVNSLPLIHMTQGFCASDCVNLCAISHIWYLAVLQFIIKQVVHMVDEEAREEEEREHAHAAMEAEDAEEHFRNTGEATILFHLF